MLCYIKDFYTFDTISKFDSTDYSLPDGDKGEVRIYQKNAVELTTKYVGMWLIINKELYYISGATPNDDYINLIIEPPIYAFSRQVVAPDLTTYGAIIKKVIDDNFGINCPDNAYKMAYMSVINTDATPCDIDADDYGYIIPYKVFDDALYEGVAIDFSFTNTALTINVYTANYETEPVVFNDGSTTLESESYDENFVAKVTVIHSLGRDEETDEEEFEVINYYLSADHHISTTPPANRAKGIWKYYTADQDTSPLSVATGAFSHNDDNHKIEFYSPKRFALYQPIKMRLRDEIFYTIITSRVLSSSDERYYYKCGKLATTLTEKIDSDATDTASEIRTIKKKLNTIVNDMDYVKTTGDTMTGNLHIEQASGDVYCYSKRTDTSVQAAMGVGSGGANHGIYSWGYYNGGFHSDSKWMIYRDYAGTVIVNGRATDNVLKSGDTMTGNLLVKKQGDTYVEAVNSNTGCRIELDSTGDGTSGIWSSGYKDSTYHASPKWLVRRKTDGSVEVDGRATDNVLKSGDTMTGNLYVTKAGDSFVQAENSATGAKVNLDSGSSQYHGIYSYGYYDGSSFHSSGIWMIYRNGAGNTVVNGRATDNVLKSGDTITGQMILTSASANFKYKMRDTSHYTSAIEFENETPSSYTYKPHIGFWNVGGNSSHPGVINIIPFGINASPWGRADGLSISHDNVKFNGTDVRVGTVAVANGGTGKTTASDALAALGGSKYVKLWTNSSPTSTFAAQTVAVGGTYNAVLIVAKTARSSSDYVTCIAVKNLSTYLEGFWTYKYARTVKLTTSGVTFGAGNGGPMEDTMTQSNDYVIPHYIYGITGFDTP